MTHETDTLVTKRTTNNKNANNSNKHAHTNFIKAQATFF